MILVGTSGFSYPDWAGKFYPAGLGTGDRLSYYSRHFPALEINFTYYRLPAAGQLAGMADKSAGRVVFAVKANREMTHTGQAREQDYTAFREALEPLAERGLLGCVLAQFPWAFRPSADSLEYLEKLKARLHPFPIVVEFRHAAWAREETFRFLQDQELGFCAVDEPRLKGLFPAIVRATAAVAYVRFHGRNAARWWKHEKASQRYDYLYRREELEEWVPKIRALDREAEKTFVFTNNHFESKAAVNAKMLMEMLL